MLAAVLVSVPSLSQAVEPLDVFSFRIGGFVNRFDTRLQADGELQAGTAVDLERDLNMDPDHALAFVALTWRPFQRHELGLSYFRESNDSIWTLERDIVVDGTLYEATTTVEAAYDLDAYETYYVWWGVARHDWALGPRVGLIWYELDFDVRMTLDANGDPVGQGGAQTEIGADLPAPAIGLSWRWTPARKWRVLAEAGYFSAHAGEVDADVVYGRAGVEWFPTERFGLMLDYSLSDVDMDSEKRGFHGRLNPKHSGHRLGLVYRF